ncbi:energy-coupled thiamine transporter ThiT [Virgibacillus profundi]|uniref:Energy-coupled thiamine transporter ThiT n=1 Tax=Virgibacillus profundi TaxID=2024555 RepID=A0A2A2IB11_9BACI|nr:energy-coupled thiamine transporter ThiT [Virgibacillus profundi]PAV28817.1 energy-coupled thiamine transporter ThiT [Virgibacillus profundi]PXY52985.1 energy-coupled thiamine transporter ThiT [Virgibacillus profundi]
MRSKRTLFLIEVAIFAAMALLLDILPFLSFKVWAQGGSVSFAMIPIFIVAFRWGVRGGILAGLLWGVLQLLFGPAIFTPLQGFLDYIVAFSVLGLAGIFAKSIQNATKEGKAIVGLSYILLGTLLGSALRFLAHFTGGIVFFGEYAPEGQPVWIYSLIYNGSYMLPGFLVSGVIVYFLFYKQPRALLNSV